VFLVADPHALSGQPFAGTGRGKGADDGNQVVVSAGLDPEHGKARLLVETGDSLDEAGELVEGLWSVCGNYGHVGKGPNC
jgi:hypothetical protein